VAALGEVVRAGVDLDAVRKLAATAADLDSSRDPLGVGDALDPHRSDVDPGRPRPVIALAGGPAFTFSYAETPELLTAAGGDVVVFDPIRDAALPARTTGIVIGGGFPEVYAQALSKNASLRAEVARQAASGAPIAAECAGLLYLAESLDGHPMCGVLQTRATMTGRLRLGYREAVAISDSVLAATGARVRGHEFHRTICEPRASAAPAWQWREAAGEGFTQGNVHASYLHLNWLGLPGSASRFVAACALANTAEQTA
jgi:cobyrinic acid a,c-diamide synthase